MIKTITLNSLEVMRLSEQNHLTNTQTSEKEKYLELMRQEYPEELEPGGLVEHTRNRFLYLDQHPEKWSREAVWVQNAWKQDQETAVLKYIYEFLLSFA